MPKGVQKTNRETKKPKKDKVKAAPGGAGPTDGLSITKVQGKGKK